MPVTEENKFKKAPSQRAVEKKLSGCSKPVKEYFEELPELLESFSWETCLAYLFFKVEQAHNRILYCGLIKLHKTDKDMTDKIINHQHLTRDKFLVIYNNVFGKAMKPNINQKIKAAEKIRDKVIHGKRVPDSEIRDAIVEVLEYAEELNAELYEIAGFRPFGSVRGFAGARTSIDNSTTRWLLKGIGFDVA